jgi:hypothetical protein
MDVSMGRMKNLAPGTWASTIKAGKLLGIEHPYGTPA